MRFFIPPPEGFTHRARLYGVPLWFRDAGEGADACGTNVVADWLLEHFCPWVQWARETVCFIVLGNDYEPAGFEFQIVRPIDRR